MKKLPPVMLIEPSSRQKQQRTARLLFARAEDYHEEEVKLRLKEIRAYSAENMTALAEAFRRNVANYNGANVAFARDAAEVVAYLNNIVPETKSVALGKSTVLNELKPTLERKGYKFIDTYSAQFFKQADIEKQLKYPWQLPLLLNQTAWDTFDYSGGLSLPVTPEQEIKDVVALLSVNAVSAEDGSIFFLQHSGNIGNMLRQAKKLVLVIGLDKLVRNSDEAFFQTRCAGAFGMESVLLDLKVNKATEEFVDPWTQIPVAAGLDRELHVILLDNGRTGIAQGEYREMLKCIACRACMKNCTGYRYLSDFNFYPREYIWSFLMGYSKSIETCIQCAMCQAECPVDIPLTKLIAMARAQYCPKIARKLDNLALMNMTTLAPLMCLFAPVVNAFAGVKPLRVIIEKMAGIDRRRRAPTFNYVTFERWFKSRHE